MGQHDDHGEDAEASVGVTPDRRPSLDRPATARTHHHHHHHHQPRFIDY